MSRQQALTQAFVELADTLVDDYDVVDLLHRLSEHSVGLLGLDAAGLLLSDQRGQLRLLAASSEQSRLLDLFQLQSDEGPCLECFRDGKPVVVGDVNDHTERWPRFAVEAANQGFRSVHALPLRLRSQIIGTINLFGQRPGELPVADVQLAQALADVATIGILQQRAVHEATVLTEQLQTALNSRIAIEQAKGILAQTTGDRDMDKAFVALRGYCRDNNARLSEVANSLAAGTTDPQTILGHARDRAGK